MKHRGTFKQSGITDILMRLCVQRTPGILTLSSSRIDISINFYNGGVTAAKNSHPEFAGRLGDVIFELGLVSGEKLAEAVSTSKATQKNIGETLVEMEFIKQRDLTIILKYQALYVIDSACRSGDGTYSFDYDPPIKKKKHCFDPIPLRVVLNERKIILEEWRQIIPSPDARFPENKTESEKKLRALAQKLLF